ncbi:hypothetical protein ABMA08_30830 [Pseudomonas yamanorum]
MCGHLPLPTLVQHSSAINVLRLALNKPGYSVDKLTMRKRYDVLGWMFSKKLQERLSSSYEI